MRLRNFAISMCVVLVCIGLAGRPGWRNSSAMAATAETNADPVDFSFPVATGNAWLYERTIIIRLGATIPMAPTLASMSIPGQIFPNKYLVRLDGFNPFRDDRPLFAEIAATPQGPIFSKTGDSRLLKGVLLSNQLAVGDMINHISGRALNPKNLVFTVASVNETVTVPAGTFKNAIQINFSYSDNIIGASGKVFLASGVGIVKAEATFNGPLRGLGLSGTAKAELRDYRVFPPFSEVKEGGK